MPDIAKTGHSFRGAMAYYLHDKRQDQASPHLSTAERVAWTETRNLATEDTATATRIMIATAKQADELKAVAGVKQTGRKSNAHVFAYSLAWHPDEAAALTRDEMRRAADSSLKALGAQDHQAVIVCHTDRRHPHVHVIVNRVHPETGRMLSTSNDRHKLDEWAHRYEKERGQIVTPDRAAKFERIEKERRKHPDSADRKAYVDGAKAKAAAEAEARHAALANARAADRPATQGQILKDLSDAQKIRHKQEWADLSARNKAARDEIYSRFSKLTKVQAAAMKEQQKPYWRAFFREQKVEAQTRRRAESSFVGLFAVSVQAARIQMQRGEVPTRGLLSQTFANVLSREMRDATFAAVQERARLAFAGQLKAKSGTQFAILSEARARALAGQREQFGTDRAALIEQQNAERAKVRDAWRQLYERRGRTPLRERSAPASVETPRMNPKKPFERAAAPRVDMAPAAPTERRFVAQSQPTPTPAGAPPVPARKVQDVPARDLSKAVAVSKPAPSPRKDWKAAAEARPAQPPRDRDMPLPTASTPAPSPRQDWKPEPRTPRPTTPAQDRTRDRDR